MSNEACDNPSRERVGSCSSGAGYVALKEQGKGFMDGRLDNRIAVNEVACSSLLTTNS